MFVIDDKPEVGQKPDSLPTRQDKIFSALTGKNSKGEVFLAPGAAEDAAHYSSILRRAPKIDILQLRSC